MLGDSAGWQISSLEWPSVWRSKNLQHVEENEGLGGQLGAGGQRGFANAEISVALSMENQKPETHKGNEGLSDPETQHSPIAD